MFDIFFNLSPEAVFLFDEKGQILRANPAAPKAFGYTLDELIGNPIDILLPAHLRGGHKELFSQFATGTAETKPRMKDFREVMAQHKDGHTFPINVAIGKEIIDGRLTLIAILRDLTYEKEIDSQIRFLATFSQENTNPTFRVQTDGKIIFCNSAGKQLLEIAGQANIDIAPSGWMREIKNSYKTGLQRESVYKYNDKTFSLVFNPIPRLGYVNIYGLDITNRENSRM